MVNGSSRGPVGKAGGAIQLILTWFCPKPIVVHSVSGNRQAVHGMDTTSHQ